MKRLIWLLLVVAATAQAQYRGPSRHAPVYVPYPMPYPSQVVYSYGSGSNHSLAGYGSAYNNNSLSVVGAKEPDAEWTPMFSDPIRKPTVQGVSVASMRGSAKGSYIYIAPGRKNGPEFQTMIKDIPPEGTIEWSKK